VNNPLTVFVLETHRPRAFSIAKMAQFNIGMGGRHGMFGVLGFNA
jgi:hypothetical protein